MKAPPFSKSFRRVPGQLPICTLYVGEFSWDGYKKHPAYSKSTALVLPPDAFPEHYRWGILDGWIVFVRGAGLVDEDLAKALLTDGAVIVVFFKHDGMAFRRTMETNSRLLAL